MVSMTTASISGLEANLSRYVNDVGRAAEDRSRHLGRSIAGLVPEAIARDHEARGRPVGREFPSRGSGDLAAIVEEAHLKLPVGFAAIAEMGPP